MKPGKIISLFVIVSALFLTGCEKSEPDVPTTDRDKFIGRWSGISNGAGGQRNFNMTITASNSAPDQILMENFDLAGTGTFLPATIGGNALSIITTTISNEIYSGTGSISGNRITFSFTLDDGQTNESRTATADRL